MTKTYEPTLTKEQRDLFLDLFRENAFFTKDMLIAICQVSRENRFTREEWLETCGSVWDWLAAMEAS